MTDLIRNVLATGNGKHYPMNDIEKAYSFHIIVVLIN